MSRTSKAAKLAMRQAYSAYIDSGSQSATIVFYEGVMPLNIETAADNSKKLVTLTLPEPSFKQVTADYVELFASDMATVIKTGTAAWARIYSGNGESVTDLEVGTDIALATTNLTIGGTLTISSIKLRP